MRRLRTHAAAIGFVAMLAIISAAFVAATAYHLRWLHEAGIGRLQDSGTAHARLFEEHLTQTLTVIDQVLLGAAERFDPAAPAAQTETLRQLLRRSPYLRSLSVLDADGRIVASSNADNLGRQPLLQAPLPQAAVDAPVLRIAYPWAGRDFADGRQATPEQPGAADSPAFIPVLRPAAAGFVLLAAVNPDYFVYSIVRTLAPADGTVEVVRLDGVLLFSTDSHVQAAAIGQQRPALGASAGAATIERVRKTSGELYEVVSRPSRLYPLALVVRLPHTEAMARFREQAAAVLAIVVPAYAAGLLFAVLAFRHIRRLVREQHEEALRARDRLMGRMFDASPEAILVTDRDNRIVAVNPAYVRLSGYSRDELLGHDPKISSSGEQDQTFYDSMWQALRRDGIWRGELVNRRKDGRHYPAALTVSAVTGVEGDVSHYFAIFSDITERREREDRIRYLSEHDVLTGLPNRALTYDRLDRAVASARRNGQRLAVLFVDLDRFKPINDTLGHSIGDRVLCEVGRRICATVRASDTVGRQGGDEFVVLLPGIGGPDDGARVAGKIIAAVGATCRIDGHELEVGASIGIGIYPEDGADIESLMRAADTAMYHAKSAGGQAYQFFSLPMANAARDRLSIEEGLRRALTQGGLRLRYQPVVSLRDGGTVAVEALPVWYDDEGGEIPAARFVPVAEDSRLIAPIGDWALREACRQVGEWRAQGLPEITLALKASPLQFDSEGFADAVLETLGEAGVPPDALQLVITESALVRHEGARAASLWTLRDRGVGIAIGGVGADSALSCLRRLPIDTVKLDPSFVAGIAGSWRDSCFVGALIEMAHRLGLRVVGEGVDDAGQWTALSNRGCDLAQGQQIAEPLTPQALLDWLRARPEAAAKADAETVAV